MGQQLGWYRLGEKWKSGGYKTPWANDAPPEFADRFDGRWAWFNAVLDSDHEQIITCGCCQNGSTYGCDTPSLWRPKDFTEFRAKQTAANLIKPIFKQMTDWLEAHPDVYVEYS